MTTLQRYLEEFDTSPSFLNFASYGPPSRIVLDELSHLNEAHADGEPGDITLLMAGVERALAAASRLSGFAPDAVVPVPSTSMGLLQLAVGIPSGTVLVASGEFPANRYPWLRAAQLGRITPRFIGAPGEAMTPELVAPQLTPDVVAVSVSAVDFRTGFRADLAGLREAIGDRLLIVDGIQGFGVIDTDWTVVDALVAGGQKWLRSGWGTGFLALSARALDRIEPVLSGWTGVADAYLFDGQLHEQAAGAAAFSVTNLSPIAFGGFAAGLELIEQVGVAAIADRIAELHDGFLERLAGTGVVALSSPDAARRAGIAPVSVPGADLAAAHAALTAEGISTTLHGPDRIRVSMHASTDPAALDRAAELLQSFA